MKKILLSLILFVLMPISVIAANYKITDYYIDASILQNGDMEVSELIVMKGTFNGYEVGLQYKNGEALYSASGLELMYVGGITNPQNISFETMKEDFREFERVTYASNGDKLKYIAKDDGSTHTFRMYYSTNNDTTAFLLKYKLKDVAINYEDCVQLYWNFFSDEFQDDIKNLKIRVNFPEKINKEDFNWWFHGPLEGNSQVYDADTYSYVEADLKGLDAYSPVDFRVLLPKDMFNTNLFRKTQNGSIKESVIAKEDEIVRKDLANIKRARILFYTTVGLTLVYYVSLVLMWIYTYLKYDKERIPQFQNEYNREFIDDYNVEVIDYLMNKNITPNAMSASIMNLIYKKNITYEEMPDSNKKDYIFTLVTKDNLNDTEIMLVNFLFDRVGCEGKFSTKDLKKYASSTRTCTSFMNSYSKWKNQVVEDGRKEGFFEVGTSKVIYGIIIFFFAMFITGFVAMFNIVFIPSFFCLFLAVIYIVYLFASHKKTEKGIEHFARWKAFEKFLKDFGTFKTKELPEIVLWERYLVYATIFGLADKVEKAMNVKIKELNLSDTYINSYGYYGPHVHIAPVINSSINSAVTGAQRAITQSYANSSGGSFGGHGGGFSSGGGFGGGGRSGGGF